MRAPNALKKVVIVSSYPFQDTNAAKARVASFLSALDGAADAWLLCRQGAEPSPALKRVEVAWPGFSQRNFVIRGVGEFLLSLRFAIALRRMKADVAIVTVPSLFLLVIGATRSPPVIFDLRDLVWDYLPDRTILQRLVKGTLSRWALSMLARAGAVVVTNALEAKKLVAALGPEHGATIIPNGLSRLRFQELVESGAPQISGRVTQSSPLHVLYVGNVGLAQDLSTLVAVAARMPAARFTIVGTGSDAERIAGLVKSLKLENVTLTGGLSWNKLASFYKEASVLWAQIGKRYESAVPSKLYEYLVVGVPIVYGGEGAAAHLLQQFSGVSVIPPSDPDRLQHALEGVDRLRSEMDVAENRRKIAEQFIREDGALALRAIVAKVTAPCPEPGPDGRRQ